MELSHIVACSKQPTAGASLEGTTAAQIAASMSTHRNCTIEIANHLVEPLEDPQEYCSSGHCHLPPPPTIAPATREAFAFSKASESVRGAVGVLTYRIGESNFRLAIMFSVPYDYNLSSNWYAIGLIPAHIPANDDLYQQMYYSDEWAHQPTKRRDKASSGITLEIRYENLVIAATMSDAKRAIIKVDITSENVQGYGTDSYYGVPGPDPDYGGDYPPPHHHHHHHHHQQQEPGWNY